MSNIEFIDSLTKQADLQSLNTLAVPVRARYLKYIDSIEELSAALDYARTQKLEILVLGEGSNVVFADDYSGLVLCNRLQGIELLEDPGNGSVLLRVAAGENWHALVEYCVAKGWNGLENLALIPGLVGAAPIQNIGAYGVELQDVFHCLECIDIKTGKHLSLNKEECEFSYRHSVFKARLKNRCVITHVTLRLSTTNNIVLKYPALAKALDTKASPKDVFTTVCQLRQSKLPNPKLIPNVGSFFKNPIVSEAKLKQLQLEFPGIVYFPFDGQFKLACAWLIEHRGWKAREYKGVRVHKDQALVITNSGKASGAAVLNLAHQIQVDIRQHFDIDLEIEPVIV